MADSKATRSATSSASPLPTPIGSALAQPGVLSMPTSSSINPMRTPAMASVFLVLLRALMPSLAPSHLLYPSKPSQGRRIRSTSSTQAPSPDQVSKDLPLLIFFGTETPLPPSRLVSATGNSTPSRSLERVTMFWPSMVARRLHGHSSTIFLSSKYNLVL